MTNPEYPYRQQASSALRGGVQHRHTVTVSGTGLTDTQVECLGCQVVMDEGWTPQIQAQITIPNDAVAKTLDPRLRHRARIDAGYYLAAIGQDVHLLADLAITSRDGKPTEGTCALTVQSDEALIDAWSPIGRSYSYGATAKGLAAIRELILAALPSATVVTDPAAPDGPVITGDDTLTVAPGDMAWSSITDITDRLGAWTYCADDRTWQITVRPQVAGTSRHILLPTDATDGSDSIGLDEWANAVIVRYTWSDTNGQHEAVGSFEVSTGSYAVAKVGRYAQVIDRTGAATIETANAAARSLALRTVTRGRTRTLTAPAAYWLRPGMTITIREDDGTLTRAIVARIAFHPHTGLMDLTPRYLDQGA